MAKQNTALINIVSFLFAACCICFCCGNCDIPPDQQQPGVDDFIENISAHYKNEIRIIEAQLAQMEFAFQKELTVVAYNQELAAKTTRQLESRMRSTATLNFKAKLCVQHFMTNVTLENVNMQTKLRTCVDTAKTNSKTVAENARNQIRNSRTQLQELLNTDMTLCRKNNANNVQKLTECAREKLKVRELNVQNMLKAAGRDIEGCMCKVDIAALTAQECSFLVILEVYTLLSEQVTNINTCIGERLLEIK
ncbi:uncharacterized protein LOC129913905 [Episyrphus balteatus]|uniref:uncharacterized protein LOC129913905 n=1 Tax=Episyrphus balteatus TaxID=286459 RepID=UPI002485AF63|nr:uncharacterized protein LOC129913905 [Episyrphus balteatus]